MGLHPRHPITVSAHPVLVPFFRMNNAVACPMLIGVGHVKEILSGGNIRLAPLRHQSTVWLCLGHAALHPSLITELRSH